MESTSRVPRASGPTRGGFTLLELLIALVFFGVVMGAMTAMQASSLALSRSNEELGAATSAAQGVMESLRAETFDEAFARWNGTIGDDPATGDSPGNAFDVPGLEPAADDPDGRVGEVVFPGDGVQLLENVAEPRLGLPRDLDLDGEVEGTDQASDYRILPFLVRVRWRGAKGVQLVELVGTLAER